MKQKKEKKGTRRREDPHKNPQPAMPELTEAVGHTEEQKQNKPRLEKLAKELLLIWKKPVQLQDKLHRVSELGVWYVPEYISRGVEEVILKCVDQAPSGWVQLRGRRLQVINFVCGRIYRASEIRILSGMGRVSNKNRHRLKGSPPRMAGSCCPRSGRSRSF